VKKQPKYKTPFQRCRLRGGVGVFTRLLFILLFLFHKPLACRRLQGHGQILSRRPHRLIKRKLVTRSAAAKLVVFERFGTLRTCLTCFLPSSLIWIVVSLSKLTACVLHSMSSAFSGQKIDGPDDVRRSARSTSLILLRLRFIDPSLSQPGLTDRF
jgi:hypothetical protein